MDLPRLDPVPPMDLTNPLEILNVFTTPIIPIANDDETVSFIPATEEQILVWDSSVDNTTARPIGFELGEAPHTLRVVARAFIPKDWANDLDCLLTGTIERGGIIIAVLSGAWKYTIPVARSDAPAEPYKFETDVEFLDPLGGKQLGSILPYGFQGQVQWTLEFKKPSLATPKLGGTKATTLLEMYRLYGHASGGPTAAVAVTRINLQGKWPVGLLRSFIPDPFDMDQLSTDDIAGLNAGLWPWWAKHAISKMQAKKQCYDAAEGRSGYGLGRTGGSLDLQGWIEETNPNLNSFDLTALLQAAFSILSTPQVPDPSRWVLMAPLGKIVANKIVPFGFDLGDGVENPFFKGLGTKNTDSDMSSFSWLEVKPDDSGPAKVVQTAFKIKAADGEDFKPDIATRSRQEFLKLCLHGPAAVSMGSDSFFTTGDFEPAKADNGSCLRRVGLYDLRGINEPWQLVKENRPSFMPMTKKLRFTVKKLLVARRTADKVDTLANDASLLPAMIFPILTGDAEFRAPPESFNLKVGRGVAVASYVVPLPLKTSAGASINVSVKIHVYETYNDALEALAFELYKFESMPAKVVIPRSDVYGSYMVQSTKSLFMVRGNLMIDMTALGLDQYKLMSGELLKMAGRLFKYLAHRVALPFQARRPNVIVAEEWRSNSKVVEPRKPFDVGVQLRGEYSAKDTMCVYIASGDGTSGVEQPIIFTGASSPEFGLDRRFSFYSLNKESQLFTREVHITIGVAHAETFFPAAATFTVNL